MWPKILGTVVAIVVVACLFAVSYGQQRVRVCENGVCRIVEMPAPQAKVDPPEQPDIYWEPTPATVVEETRVYRQSAPSFPTEVRYVQSTRSTQSAPRVGLLRRVAGGLRGLVCRRNR